MKPHWSWESMLLSAFRVRCTESLGGCSSGGGADSCPPALSSTAASVPGTSLWREPWKNSSRSAWLRTMDRSRNSHLSVRTSAVAIRRITSALLTVTSLLSSRAILACQSSYLAMTASAVCVPRYMVCRISFSCANSPSTLSVTRSNASVTSVGGILISSGSLLTQGSSETAVLADGSPELGLGGVTTWVGALACAGNSCRGFECGADPEAEPGREFDCEAAGPGCGFGCDAAPGGRFDLVAEAGREAADGLRVHGRVLDMGMADAAADPAGRLT
mmetsp:Transcript_132129/g.229066  ORF Transcript_132129/g.229066 Transcript_132129/m.229066 type:complete len:275 (+) Transcript_132129:37-861(+)